MRLLIEFFSYMLIIAFSEKVLADSLKLPPPDLHHKVVNISKVIGWPSTLTPKAPLDFKVTKFASGFRNVRWIYVGPNGDIFVAESHGNRISILRDANNDGIPEVNRVFLQGLKLPFGMLVLKNFFYVANTDSIKRFLYLPGETRIRDKGEKIKDLPKGGHHWTRNIIANNKGDKIYVAVGSSSNIGENGMNNENRRASILEMNIDGSNEKIYASGLRNPVGMDWAPGTHTLWTVVNERDFLGDDLVPDYLTDVQAGGFYGWPYAYWGKNPDPRLKGARADLVAKSIEPSMSLGAHTASLGLTFYPEKAGPNSFPEKYINGAFIGQHGSWNRSNLSGYKVVFVPFKDGKPQGPPEDFLIGFIADPKKSEVYGRPVGVAVLLNEGSLLVADDASNIIWKVTYTKALPK